MFMPSSMSSSALHKLFWPICHSLLLFSSFTTAQNAVPSDGLIQTPPLGSPQFFLRVEKFGQNPIFLAPLNKTMTDTPPQSFSLHGTLVKVSPDNANKLNSGQIALLSCDDSSYPGAWKVHDALEAIISSNPTASAIVLYTAQSRSCKYDADSSLRQYPNIFSTTKADVGASLQTHIEKTPDGISSIMTEAPSSTDGSGVPQASTSAPASNNPSSNNPSTTSVAMIILYTVTGVITILFLGVIVTGAIRAHRHPERYGPREFNGRPRQGRAKGLARAILETLPVVKFGDLDEPRASQERGVSEKDIEKGDHRQEQESVLKETETASQMSASNASEPDRRSSVDRDEQIGPASSTRSGTPDGPGATGGASGTLECPICTEEFERGQDVRLLPCDHKFHPECIDPWLVNVSGTCPLCRIDLNPHHDDPDDPHYDPDFSSPLPSPGLLPPPIQDNRGPGSEPNTSSNARRHRRSLATFIQSTLSSMPPNDASIEQRLEAVRRLRTSPQQDGRLAVTGAAVDNRRSRRFSTMLRDSFRIHTRRHGDDI